LHSTDSLMHTVQCQMSFYFESDRKMSTLFASIPNCNRHSNNGLSVQDSQGVSASGMTYNV